MRHQVRKRVKTHFVSHTWLYLTIFIGLGVVLCGAFLNFQSLRTQVNLAVKQEFEKNSLAQLDIFHTGTTALVTNTYQSASRQIQNTATDKTIVAGISSGKMTDIQPIIERQRAITQNFDSISVFDSNGVLMAIARDVQVSQNLIGKSSAEQPGIKAVIETQKPVLGPRVVSKIGRVVITFAAPVFDNNKKFIGIVNGSMTLDGLAKRTNLESPFTKFESLLVDSKGNLILKNGSPVKEPKNLEKNEPIYNDISSGKSTASRLEINYEGQRVFAKASSIEIENFGKVAVISYYLMTENDRILDRIQNDLNNVFSNNFFRSAFLFLLLIIVLVWAVKRDSNSQS